MADHVQSDLVERLRAVASDFVQRREFRARRLADMARKRGWMIFAFGGVPRGLDAHGGRYIPRDLDLVFDDSHFEEFAHFFSSEIRRRTRFGGLHLFLNGLEVDAWPRSTTWAFREGLVDGASFARLPETTFLNYDGVVLQFATRPGQARRVYAEGLEKTKKRGALDIELEPNPFPALCVVRSLRLSAGHQLPITPRLAHYCWSELATRNLDEFVRAQESHYGVVQFDQGTLSRVRRKLEAHLESSPLFDFALVSQPDFWDRGFETRSVRAAHRFDLPKAFSKVKVK